MAGADINQLLLQIDANIELLRRNLDRGSSDVEDFNRRGQRGLDRFDRRMERVGGSGMPRLKAGLAGITSSLGALTAAFGVASIGAAGATFLKLADQAKAMRSQLTLATAEFGNFGQAQADVDRIAATTRIGLEASTKLYGNFLRTSAPLGRTQADAARATETFAKALKIGGAGAEEASAATLQFSQALASGVLRGDEFNSIAEASPRVLKLFADALGIPQGQLRALAQEGKLTSDKLYSALTDKKITAGVDAEFKQLPVTFAESMTLVHDAAITAFGAFDRGGGFSDAIAHFVGDGADGFSKLSRDAEAAGSTIRAAFAGLGNVFDPLGAGGDSVFDALGIRIQSTREQIAGLLSIYDSAVNLPLRASNAGVRFGNWARSFTGGVQMKETPLSDAAGSFRQGYDRSASRSRYEAAARRLQDLGFIVPRTADGLVDEAGIRRRPVAPARTTPPPATSGSGKSKGASRSRSPRAEQPFKLAPFAADDDFLSPRGIAEAARKFARDQNEAFTAIFGDDDPLASIIAGAKDAQVKAVDDWSQSRGMDKGLSPLVEFREQMRAALEDTNAVFQGVAIDGLQSLEDGLVGVIEGTESVAGAFKRMADGIVADLARIAIRKAIVAALDAAIPGAATFLNIGGKAGGGRIEGKAAGGRITGPGTGTSDSILALIDGRRPLLVSNGESIVTAQATREHWPLIDAMNKGKLPRFAAGGRLDLRSPAMPSMSAPSLPSLASRSARGGQVVHKVEVDVTPSPLFEASVRVQSAQMIGAAADPIMAGAEARTVRRLRRPTLPGGLG